MKKVLVITLISLFCLFLVNRLYGGYTDTIVFTLEDESKSKTESNSVVESPKNDSTVQVTPSKSVAKSTTFYTNFIVIDPGHGTKGSRGGANGEAAFNLSAAKKIFAYLDQNKRFTPILTHSFIGENLGARNADDDNKIRARIANRVNAKLYLRIHCDAPNGASSIYYPRLHSNRNLAKSSETFARNLNQPIRSLVSGVRYGGIRGDESTAIGRKNGGLLTGSMESKVPVVLIEMVPLNSERKRWISSDANQDKMARVIASTIEKTVK